MSIRTGYGYFNVRELNGLAVGQRLQWGDGQEVSREVIIVTGIRRLRSGLYKVRFRSVLVSEDIQFVPGLTVTKVQEPPR
jgi:hypothetical protein